MDSAVRCPSVGRRRGRPSRTDHEMASLSPSPSPSPEGGLGNIINAADCDYRLRTTDKELTDEQTFGFGLHGAGLMVKMDPGSGRQSR